MKQELRAKESLSVNSNIDLIICRKCFLSSSIFLYGVTWSMKYEEKQDLVGNNKVNLKTSTLSRQDLNAQNTSFYAQKWNKGENIWMRCSPDESNGDYLQNKMRVPSPTTSSLCYYILSIQMHKEFKNFYSGRNYFILISKRILGTQNIMCHISNRIWNSGLSYFSVL